VFCEIVTVRTTDIGKTIAYRVFCEIVTVRTADIGNIIAYRML